MGQDRGDSRAGRVTRLVVVGGFLGAGKTTALLRLAEHWASRGRRVGVLTNDQSEDLVDTARFAAAGFATGEVTGGCFCCRFDDFVARADALLEAARPQLLLAEPVGSCTDLVATVLAPLARFHADRFRIAPFTVLVDPRRLLAVLGGRGPARLSQKVAYIYRLQQQEADLLAVSKLDLLDEGERAEVEALLAARFPEAERLAFSAVSGEGVDALAARLVGDASAAGRALADIDYDAYAEGEAELGWLDTRLQLETSTPLDLDGALLDLGRRVDAELGAAGIEIAHAKLLLRGDRRSAVVSLVGAGVAPELAQRADERATRLDLLVNLRAQADPHRVQQGFQVVLDRWLAAHAVGVEGGGGRAFKPPRPVPTHRFAPD